MNQSILVEGTHDNNVVQFALGPASPSQGFAPLPPFPICSGLPSRPPIRRSTPHKRSTRPPSPHLTPSRPPLRSPTWDLPLGISLAVVRWEFPPFLPARQSGRPLPAESQYGPHPPISRHPDIPFAPPLLHVLQSQPQRLERPRRRQELADPAPALLRRRRHPLGRLPQLPLLERLP